MSQHFPSEPSELFKTFRSPAEGLQRTALVGVPEKLRAPRQGYPHPTHTPLLLFFGRGRGEATKDIHELREGRNQSSTSFSLLAPLFSPWLSEAAHGYEIWLPKGSAGAGNSFRCLSCGVDMENGARLVALRA